MLFGSTRLSTCPYTVCSCLSGLCVLVGMVRWQSCVMLWPSELSWMLILQRNQWNQCCHLESFLLVRERQTLLQSHSMSMHTLWTDTVCYFLPIFTGSTDVVSCSVHGVRDPVTAALHIVLGMSLCSIYVRLSVKFNRSIVQSKNSEKCSWQFCLSQNELLKLLPLSNQLSKSCPRQLWWILPGLGLAISPLLF